MYTFDPQKTKDDIVGWIRGFFEANGRDCRAVVAVSGGKDSSVTAALCVEALGRDRVFGVLLPNGEQADIDMSLLLTKHLSIEYTVINIESIFEDAVLGLEEALPEVSRQTRINLAPRIRMAMTYAVSQSLNGRVANTSNLSEDWVGYATRWGDTAGDFSPLSKLTVAEVKAVGHIVGLPDVLVDKTPADGLTDLTDEDNLGFTYATLDRYIRTGICEDAAMKALIDARHRANKFKLELMPSFPYDAPVLAEDVK